MTFRVFVAVLLGVYLSTAQPAGHDTKCDAVERCSCTCNNGVQGAKYTKTERDCQWRMAFKAVAGNERDVHDDFLNGGNVNEHVEGAKDITSTMPFRDGSILDNWYQLVIEQVKIEVFSGGVQKSWFVFNGLGSDIKSWMSQANLIASPYKDIKSVSLQYDSVDGDTDRFRRFFLNARYEGCPSDCGYLVVVNRKADDRCPWEKLAALPYFMYSKDTCSRYQVTGEAGIGDRFIISVKTCDIY